jgi:hypothetical protein
MTDHTDRTLTVAQQDTDTTRQDVTVGVIDAARILSVSTDAVRARLRRGTLQGHKINGEWRVIIGPLLSKGQDATVSQQDAQQSGNRTSTVDLTPLTDLIERQAHDLADARAAATLWQSRARTLEDRLLAIEPGTMATEGAPENETGPQGLLGRMRRLWRG